MESFLDILHPLGRRRRRRLQLQNSVESEPIPTPSGRVYGTTAQRVFVNSVDSEKSVHIEDLYHHHADLREACFEKLQYCVASKKVAEREIDCLNSEMDYAVASLSVVDLEVSRSLVRDLEAQANKIKGLELDMHLLFHLKAALDIFDKKIERSLLRKQIEDQCKNYTVRDWDNVEHDLGESNSTLDEPVAAELNSTNLLESERRTRNRHSYVIGQDSGYKLVRFSRKRKADESQIDPEDKAHVTRNIKKKILFRNRIKYASQTDLGTLDLYDDVHKKYCQTRMNLPTYIMFSRHREKVSKYFDETMQSLATSRTEPPSAFFKAMSPFNPVNGINNIYNFTHTRQLTTTLSHGFKFEANCEKLLNDVGLSIIFDFLYPLHNSSDKKDLQKFIQQLNILFAIEGGQDLSAKFLQGKMFSSLEFYKFWLFNNFNFVEELQHNKQWTFVKTTELLKMLDCDASRFTQPNMLRFNIKVLNFEDIALVSNSFTKTEKTCDFSCFLHDNFVNNQSMHMCPKNENYNDLIQNLFNDNITHDQYRDSLVRERKLQKWSELPPFDNIKAFSQFLAVVGCNNCLKQIQENFALMEWSLIDIDDKLANYNTERNKIPNFDEDKYFSDSMFFHNSEFAADQKFDFNNLCKTENFTKDYFISQIGKVKLFVVLNKHTNEISVSKYKHFSSNAIISHFMEEYTSIIEKVSCSRSTKNVSQSFEFC